jgi:hypothetical protein
MENIINQIIENKVHEVLVNSVHPDSVSDIKWIEDQPVQPITDFEKALLKGTLNASELLEQEQKEKEKPPLTQNEIDYNAKRDYITRVKCVALDLMGKHPLDNPTKFSTREKKRLMEQMEMVMTKTEEEIINLFNSTCNEVIFSPEADYTRYTSII